MVSASAGITETLLTIGVIGTGLAYLLNLALVRGAGTAVASAVTYVMPLWSTALGAALLHEPVGWNALVGGALVIAAVALTRPRRAGAGACEAASEGAAGEAPKGRQPVG
ncbi:EamA family transporter [Kitasatospora sp. NPDC091335]|uniref:EamA family transporter n=1 Tax=Kitasatospora sp. NPDC091335 TaxID=3364085 RepID=UPI00381A826F